MMFRQVFTLLAGLMLLSACGADKRPDTIYLGGKIYTGNPEMPVVEAVGTIDSRIVYVGDANGVVKDTRPTTKLVDLTGKVMYPGFINTYAGSLANGVDDAAGSQIEASAIEYAKQGWTTVHAINVEPDNVRIMEDLAMQGKLPVRVYNVLNETGFESLSTYGPGVSPGGLVETRAVLLDTTKPFTPFKQTGDVPSLDEVLETALKNHVQLLIKSPDAELDALLDIINDAFSDAAPDADPRWVLLAEFGKLSEGQMDRVVELGIRLEFGDSIQRDHEFDRSFPSISSNAAYAGFRESMIGSIEVRKMADFTILSGDLYAETSGDDETSAAVMTIIGGAQAWPRPERKLPVFGQ